MGTLRRTWKHELALQIATCERVHPLAEARAMLRRCACVVALLTVINYWRSHHKTSVRHLIIRFLNTLYFNAMVFRYRPGIRPSAEHMALDKIMDLTAVGSHL